MNIGKMNKLITIQKSAKTKSAAGKRTITWTDIGKVWCQFVDTRGREFMAAKQANLKLTHILRIRYWSSVTNECRAKYGDEILNFDSVSNTRQANEEMLIEAIQEAA